jgi:hypothetical protein
VISAASWWRQVVAVCQAPSIFLGKNLYTENKSYWINIYLTRKVSTSLRQPDKKSGVTKPGFGARLGRCGDRAKPDLSRWSWQRELWTPEP